MAFVSDREPIVDEMETEHGEAVNTAVLSSASSSIAPRAEVTSAPVLGYLTIPWTFVRSCVNTLLYTLLGGSAFVTLWFGTKSEMTVFYWHIVLSVIGYQLLMPYAMLCLQSHGWASALAYTHRRRAHWIMQLMGSVLAFTGSVIMMAQKTVNFNTLHGRFALMALLLTILSLSNGVTSLYTTQLRQYISPRVSILSHSLIGTMAFLLSSVCLIYGYLKHSFAEWASREFTYFLIATTCINTILICWPPMFKVFRQVFEAVKSKIF